MAWNWRIARRLAREVAFGAEVSYPGAIRMIKEPNPIILERFRSGATH